MTQVLTLTRRLDTPVRRFIVAATAVVLAGGYLALAGQQLIASWLANRAEVSSLKRAIQLDPRNADNHDQVGRFYERDARDPVSAVKEYRAATDLNPHSGRYWLDLAGAYRVLGDTVNQSAAIERSVEADPMTPDVAWEAANLYTARGDDEKALREFAIVVAGDPSLAGSAVESCWRLKPDVDALLRDVIPAQVQAYVAFLTLLEGKEETAGTIRVWNALIQTHQRFEVRHSYDYIRYLILHKEPDQALTVWKQTAALFGLSPYLASPNNLVANGNFDLEPLNAGFDWQYQKQPSVSLTLDPTESHGGRRSLLITFDGPGIAEAGIFQFIPTEPRTTYAFAAYYKNSEMQGAGGPHFAIQDMYAQTVYYQSDELKDGQFWKSVNGEFTTGADGKLVVLRILRLPSGSPIRGKLWVGDFRIAKSPS